MLHLTTHLKQLWSDFQRDERSKESARTPTMQVYLVLCFPVLRQVSPRQFFGVLQGIAADIGISNLLRAFFMISLNSSSSSSMNKYHVIFWHHRTLVSR